MPLEYIYTFAPRTHNSSGGSGFVVWPPKELRAEKVARQIVTATGVDDYRLGDRPFYSFTKHNQTCALTRTFTTPHYSTGQPSRFSHIMLLDPRERAFLTEGPIYALRHFRFQTEYGQTDRWPREQTDFQPLPVKEPRPIPQCETWKALTGDAGWCGLCAEQVMEGKKLFWVYDPEKTEGSELLLDLLDELFQLLPAERRWSVTFNTRVDLPAQISQQILCFEEEKESVISQIRLPQGQKSVTIPLHRLSETPCPDSDWANYARTGLMTVTNFETGVMALNSDQYTRQELIEKFEKNYVQAEELEQAASELGTIENLIDNWESKLYERKKELEDHFNELGERQEFLGNAAAEVLRCLERRRAEVAERNRELERWEAELGKRCTELQERQRFLTEFEGSLRAELKGTGGELAGNLYSVAKSAERCRAGIVGEIEKLQESAEGEAENFCQRLRSKAEEYCGQIGSREDEFYGRIEQEGRNFLAKITGQTKGFFGEIREDADEHFHKLERIGTDITNEYAELRSAKEDLAEERRKLEECRGKLGDEWKSLVQRAEDASKAIKGKLSTGKPVQKRIRASQSSGSNAEQTHVQNRPDPTRKQNYKH